MAFTAATAQPLVQTTLEKLTIAKLAVEQYMLCNNPGDLAAAVAALAATTAAITAVSA